jgi:hypothetical protein
MPGGWARAHGAGTRLSGKQSTEPHVLSRSSRHNARACCVRTCTDCNGLTKPFAIPQTCAYLKRAACIPEMHSARRRPNDSSVVYMPFPSFKVARQ